MKILIGGLAWFSAMFAAPAGVSGEPSVAAVRAMPAHPIIEDRGGNRFINFDMIVTNRSHATLRLTKIEQSVYDAAYALVLRRALNTDAFAPSIAVIGNQLLAPGQSLDVFNPFPQFEAQVPLSRLDYSFCLQRERSDAEREKNLHRLPDDCDFEVETSVTPRVYTPKTAFTLPLKGKIFVWEGHDFYAHHLRVPFSNPKVQAMGIMANSNEFANDFIYTDSRGRPYHDDPRRIENWYSYGKPIYAPGGGKVVAAANTIPDNWFEDVRATKIGYPKLAPGQDPDDMGNFVLIDHGDGEFSLLLHMKPGSVRVKPGDAIETGQQIGQIGFTGDSLFPHLHYTVMEGPTESKSWGLPAYFTRFHRVYGARSVEVSRGPVNSGDFVESDVP